MTQNDPLIPAVERTLQLIELIALSSHGYSPQELLNIVDIPRSTLFQLLKTLKNLGYLEQNEKRGRYRAGPRLDAWSKHSHPSLGKDLIACFYSEANRAAFNETILLITRSEGKSLISAQIESPLQVRSVYPLGAWQTSPSFVDTVFQPPAGHDLIQYGVAVFESADSWECIAPICPDGVHPTAAVLISAPRSRWQLDTFRDAFNTRLRSLASRLSYQMGAQSYTPYRRDEHSALQATSEMSLDEISSFLQGPWSARLACIRPDGRPHVVPVWQDWDGKQFSVLAWKGSYWANVLSENPNVSLTIDEPWPPFHRVVVRGTAQKETHAAVIQPLLERMSRRYMGSVIPELDQRIECAFRITPEQLKGWKGIAAADA